MILSSRDYRRELSTVIYMITNAHFTTFIIFESMHVSRFEILIRMHNLATEALKERAILLRYKFSQNYI